MYENPSFHWNRDRLDHPEVFLQFVATRTRSHLRTSALRRTDLQRQESPKTRLHAHKPAPSRGTDPTPRLRLGPGPIEGTGIQHFCLWEDRDREDYRREIRLGQAAKEGERLRPRCRHQLCELSAFRDQLQGHS